MNNQSIAHKLLNHLNTLLHRTAYARLIKSSTTTRARARYYTTLNDHFTDHYTYHTLHTPSLIRYLLHLHNLHVGTLDFYGDDFVTRRISTLYI